MLKEYLALGGILHTLSTPSLNSKTFFSFYRKVNRFFKTHNDYDFFHIHVADDPFVVDVAKRKGIMQIGIHAHTTGYNESYRSQGLKGKIRKRNVNLAHHHLAITYSAAQWMFPEEKNVEIIHNGIEAAGYSYNEKIRSEYRKQLKIENQYVMMHVGRFSEVKNHLFMLKLLEKTIKIIPNCKLVFVGDGPLFEKIKHAILHRNLENNVLLLGARLDVANLLQAADVFLLPSKFEGLGLSAVESQAAGLPTLVSNQVPTEVAVTDLVSFLPLDDSVDEWVAEVEKAIHRERRNTYQEIVEAHYEIKQTTNDLINFYFNTFKE